MKKIRVLIIDEHPAVCQALSARLDAVPSLEVAGTACTLLEGVESAQLVQPDVILLELKSRGDNGIDAIDAVSRLLTCGPTGVIVLTSYLDVIEREDALEAGARRYLLKDIDTRRLIDEIEAVATEGMGPLRPAPRFQEKDIGSSSSPPC